MNDAFRDDDELVGLDLHRFHAVVKVHRTVDDVVNLIEWVDMHRCAAALREDLVIVHPEVA